MNEANELIEKLKEYYKVATSQELAEKIGVSQPTVSSWKQRNAVGSITKKIYELGLDIALDETPYKKTISNLLAISLRSVSAYDKKNIPIISLLEKYFTNKELEEFLETGAIQKQEFVKDITNDKLKEILKNTYNQKILDEIETLKRKLF